MSGHAVVRVCGTNPAVWCGTAGLPVLHSPFCLCCCCTLLLLVRGEPTVPRKPHTPPPPLYRQMWVLFRDENGKASCVHDECAHRACPLSLGTVEAGRVQCAYHGECQCAMLLPHHPLPRLYGQHVLGWPSRGLYQAGSRNRHGGSAACCGLVLAGGARHIAALRLKPASSAAPPCRLAVQQPRRVHQDAVHSLLQGAQACWRATGNRRTTPQPLPAPSRCFINDEL